MLQAPKTLAASALIPFVPRQVMLDSKASASIESKIKEKEMEKESKKKTKKSKSSKQSETLENGSVAPTKGRNWQMLLSSIAAFLESSGFHKTLAVFRSETQLEVWFLLSLVILSGWLWTKYLLLVHYILNY